MKYNQGVADSNRRRTKHGHASRDRGATKVYRAWVGIKQRCTKPSCSAWHRYGGRGITMHKPWINSFDKFYSYIGDPPTDLHTIDRINNDRGYVPGNVRWATRKEQSNNIGSNVWVKHRGKRMTWAQWAEHLNVPYNLLMSRVKRKIPLEEILKPRLNRKRNELIKVGRTSKSLREWAAHTGIKYQTLYARWKAGKQLF